MNMKIMIKMRCNCDTSMDGMGYPSSPFACSQAKELQDLQAMFVKKEVSGKFEECRRKTYNVWKIKEFSKYFVVDN